VPLNPKQTNKFSEIKIVLTCDAMQVLSMLLIVHVATVAAFGTVIRWSWCRHWLSAPVMSCTLVFF